MPASIHAMARKHDGTRTISVYDLTLLLDQLGICSSSLSLHDGLALTCTLFLL